MMIESVYEQVQTTGSTGIGQGAAPSGNIGNVANPNKTITLLIRRRNLFSYLTSVFSVFFDFVFHFMT